MKQSGHLNPSEETRKYGRTPPHKHGGVGRHQQPLLLVVLCGHQCTSAREWSVRLHLR